MLKRLILGLVIGLVIGGLVATAAVEMGFGVATDASQVVVLYIMAALTGMIAAANQGSVLSAPTIVWISAKALGFLLGAILLGLWLAPKLLAAASRTRGAGILLTTALVFCFVLAYLATRVGLSPIVGAFAAGLVLETRRLPRSEESGETSLELETALACRGSGRENSALPVF